MASAWTRPKSQGFGPTAETLDGPYQGYAHFNKGTDFAAAAGDTVEARVPGTVIAVGNQGDGWGFSVKIRDAQGNTHNYGHLDPSIPVKVGQEVGAGELVGKVGAKIEGEASTGSHLSYDVWDSQGQFFDALAQDSSGGGSVTQPSAGGTTGRYFKDPALDSTYQSLRDAFLNAQKAWISAGRAQQGPQFDSYWETMTDLSDFTDQFGHPSSSANDTDPAQQEFENRIALGDFEGRNADRAFSQWFDKYTAAQQNATADFNQRSQHNQDLAANDAARNTSQTPSQLSRNTDRGYIEQSRSELMDAYLKKNGIGYEPPAGGASGIQTPGQQSAAGAAAARGPSTSTQFGTPLQDIKFGGGEGTTPPPDPGKANPWDTHQNQPKSTFWGPDGATFDQEKQSGSGFKLIDYNRPMDIAGKVAGLATIGPKAATSVNKKVKKWWQKGFAEGGMNIPAQQAWVGEKGPEIMEVPGFGARMVGHNGPEQMNIPEGANIIPMDEAFAMSQIQNAARQGNQPDVAQQTMDAQQRMNDPELQAKVLASMKKAMSSNLIANPPYTPVLENPAIQRDIWAPNRQITGIPASQEEMAMMQEQAAKGAKRG